MTLRIAALAVSLWLAGSTHAQCEPVWFSGSPLRGSDGTILGSTWWDPDGTGPLGARLVLVGTFSAIGDVAARRIASWDPTTDTWSEIGGGAADNVHDVVALPNGDLVAVGEFTSIGGVAANRIARYSGGAWAPLGSGLGGFVPSFLPWAVTALPNGDIVAGGDFSSAGGIPVQRVARWDGSAWHPLGGGVNGFVARLLALPSGELIAGGYFTTAGGQPAGKIARWDGTAWQALGTGLDPGTGSLVRELVRAGNGDVLVGGTFSIAGGQPADGLARWNGATWTSYANPWGGVVAVRETASGQLLVAPRANLGPTQLHIHNGAAWQPLAPALDNDVQGLQLLPNGDVLAYGPFTAAGSTPASGIARWTGAAWLPIRSGFDGRVAAIAELTDGSIVVGGLFSRAPSLLANGLARFHGGTWSTFGNGVTTSPPSGSAEVTAVIALPQGGCIIGGRFDAVAGVAAANVARWDGNAWFPLGGGVAGQVNALALAANGDVYAAGFFQSAGGVPAASIARWDGTAWWPLGSGLGFSAIVYALHVLPNGDLIAGGSFHQASGAPADWIARFDGTSWHALGSGIGGAVRAIARMPDSSLVVAAASSGALTPVARWSGTVWSPLGAGLSANAQVYSLLALPDGQVVAGGELLMPGQHLARCADGAWSPWAGGTESRITALHRLRGGGAMVGGTFSRVGITGGSPVAARSLALLLPSCPAGAAIVGSGCAGSAGPVTLAASTLPWLGSTFVSTATGMPQSGFGIVALGSTGTSVPLASVLPTAISGCTLHVAPVLLEVYLPNQGVLVSTLQIPTAIGLLGLSLRQQVVGLALDATGSIVEATSSPALLLTPGMF